jgi:uncharacterized protein YukE
MTSAVLVSLVVAGALCLLQVVVLRRAIATAQAISTEWTTAALGGSFRHLRREDAIRELTDATFDGPVVVGFHRLGTTAPLIGVVLTIAAVLSRTMTTDAPASGPDGESTLKLITTPAALASILAGVGCGALLAILNQALSVPLQAGLSAAIRSATSQAHRNCFRDTDDRFDSVVATIRDAATALEAGVQSLDTATTATADVARQLSESAGLAATQLRTAASAVDDALQAPRRQLDACLADLNAALSRAGNLLLETNSQLIGRADQVAQSATQFSAQSARSSDVLSASLENLNATTRLLGSSAKQLMEVDLQALARNTQASARIAEESSSRMMDVVSQLENLIQRQRTAAESLTAPLGSLGATVQGTTKAHTEAALAASLLRTALSELTRSLPETAPWDAAPRVAEEQGS